MHRTLINNKYVVSYTVHILKGEEEDPKGSKTGKEIYVKLLLLFLLIHKVFSEQDGQTNSGASTSPARLPAFLPESDNYHSCYHYNNHYSNHYNNHDKNHYNTILFFLFVFVTTTNYF